MQYTDAVQIEMFIFQPMSSEKKKINGGYSLIGLPVIHLKQNTYPVDAVGTVDRAKVQIFRTHGQRNSGIPEMSELIY